MGNTSSPTCTLCDYPLSGLTPDAECYVRCPECGTEQEPTPPGPSPTVTRFLLWNCLPPFGVWVVANAAVRVSADAPAVLILVGAAMGVGAPVYYSTRIVAHTSPRVRRRWVPLLLVGWVLNFAMGVCAIMLMRQR